MTLTTEDDLDLVWQMTQHAMLVAWGRFSRHLQLSERCGRQFAGVEISLDDPFHYQLPLPLY